MRHIKSPEGHFVTQGVAPPMRPNSAKPIPFVEGPPELLLDILICTLDSRLEQFERLRDKLQRQITASIDLHNQVRVLSECDDGKLSIGAKRNILLSRARAEFVCFVDDDDDVTDEYVPLLLEALSSRDVDCVGIVGEIMHPLNHWRQFVHSLEFKGYAEEPSRYTRPPNHLNPIRRYIAVKYAFREVSHGEDTDYAVRMLGAHALQTQRFIPATLYRYVPSQYQ